MLQIFFACAIIREQQKSQAFVVKWISRRSMERKVLGSISPIKKQQKTEYAPLAQLDRALVYGTKGWGFELLKVHQIYGKALKTSAFFLSTNYLIN